MPTWAQWRMAWRWPIMFFAGFGGSIILWILGSHRDDNSTEVDVESGQKSIGGINDSPTQDEFTSLCIQNNLIAVGVFAHVYNLGNGRVRKVPGPDPDNYDLAIQSIRREGEIYRHLGNHSRIIKCLAKGDLSVDLEFASQGHLQEYLQRHPDTPDECRSRFAQEVIEAVEFIHSKGVIHSDLAARQFLIDDKLQARLSDFGFSSIGGSDVLGFEISSHFLPRDTDMPSSIQSDLFALGSTLYEISTGKQPYEGMSDDNINRLYSTGSFPSITGILYGDVIMGCWQGSFTNATEVLKHLLSL